MWLLKALAVAVLAVRKEKKKSSKPPQAQQSLQVIFSLQSRV